MSDVGRHGERQTASGNTAAGPVIARSNNDAFVRQRRARMLVYRYAVVIALVVFFVGFSILLPTTFFTIGNGMTLPTLVWGMLRTALDPSINALGTLILIATITSSAIALSITRYRG